MTFCPMALMASPGATEKMPISITGKALKKAKSSWSAAAPARGFSLIELMIVLVIMTLVLGMAGPRVAKQMAVLHLRTAAKQMAASLRWARSQALSTGKIYNAVFDCGGGRLIISDYAAFLEVDTLNLAQSPNEQAAPDAPDSAAAARKPTLKIFEFPEDVFISRVEIGEVIDANPGKESVYQLTFFPDGTSMGGEIRIADEQGRFFILTVDFLTGIVSLEEPEN
jgi:general secretion pathway protein H